MTEPKCQPNAEDLRAGTPAVARARPRSHERRALAGLCLASLLAALACATVASAPEPRSADDLLIVDCLLPGRVRQLGTQLTYLEPRRAIKTTAHDCAIRGGEYTAYDRSNYATALEIWLPQAQAGDPEAQNYVGEIYEKGLGLTPDYEAAALWYRRAADKGYAAAMINLGTVYEKGLGVPRDPEAALQWYRRASGLAGAIAFVPSDAPEVAAAGAENGGTAVRATAAGATAVAAAPTIEVLDPRVTRKRGGWSLVPTQVVDEERVIVGRVVAPAGLVSLTVNDRRVEVNDAGMFETRVAVAAAGTAVQVVAVDERGKIDRLEFRLEPTADGLPMVAAAPSPAPALDFGRYYALVVGNNDYQYLPKLVSAGPDARAVSAILERKYGFEVTSIYDADRYQIMRALNELRKKLTQDDNLLIYYAGHGELDRVNMRGNWLPVDAESDSTANWISNVSLTDVLNSMNARHVLIIADSCYSGTLTRAALARLEAGSTDEERRAWIEQMAQKRSRTALTSGGLAPVLDGGSADGHSVFAGALISILEENDEVIEGQRLYFGVAAKVAHAAEQKRFEQLPQYAPIKHGGHESGDFFFVPARPSASRPPYDADPG